MMIYVEVAVSLNVPEEERIGLMKRNLAQQIAKQIVNDPLFNLEVDDSDKDSIGYNLMTTEELSEINKRLK